MDVKNKRIQKSTFVFKAIETWLQEADWPPIDAENNDNYVGTNFPKINYPILWKLAKKIELATQLKTTTHLSATYMQVSLFKASA